MTKTNHTTSYFAAQFPPTLMIAKYHIAVLTETIGSHFSPAALGQIIEANLGQDRGLNQLKWHVHFDNCAFAKGRAYVEEQHALIAGTDDPAIMRAAFGRLSHAIQDFYSHSNYVDLWLESNGGFANTCPEDINGLDPALLNHPGLTSGYFYLWRDIIYYLPIVDRFAKKHLVFPGSHEAMNLDAPSTGPKFPYSIIAAKQRTLSEYQRATQALGPERAARFHGALL
ncbi:MAG: hypothetical protein HYZ49_04630 [Chloroflexi bacterium]|nr:hypothetical protein [Chloroflexota bacterium]